MVVEARERLRIKLLHALPRPAVVGAVGVDRQAAVVLDLVPLEKRRVPDEKPDAAGHLVGVDPDGVDALGAQDTAQRHLRADAVAVGSLVAQAEALRVEGASAPVMARLARINPSAQTGNSYSVTFSVVNGVLLRHPAVLEAATVALPDAAWGEIPVACVVLRPDGKADPAAAVQALFRLHPVRRSAGRRAGCPGCIGRWACRARLARCC